METNKRMAAEGVVVVDPNTGIPKPPTDATSSESRATKATLRTSDGPSLALSSAPRVRPVRGGSSVAMNAPTPEVLPETTALSVTCVQNPFYVVMGSMMSQPANNNSPCCQCAGSPPGPPYQPFPFLHVPFAIAAARKSFCFGMRDVSQQQEVPPPPVPKEKGAAALAESNSMQNKAILPPVAALHLAEGNMNIKSPYSPATFFHATSADLQEIDVTRPPFSYSALIAMAILSSPKKMASLLEIYKYVIQSFPYYKEENKKWKNSIRHNLSLNKCFQKVPRKTEPAAKGNYWIIDPASDRVLENGSFRSLSSKNRRRKTTPPRASPQQVGQRRELESDHDAEVEVAEEVMAVIPHLRLHHCPRGDGTCAPRSIARGIGSCAACNNSAVDGEGLSFGVEKILS